MSTSTRPKALPLGDHRLHQVLQSVLRNQISQIALILAMMLLVFSLLRPASFLTVDNIRSIAVNVSILSILGVGTTFVIITGGIDLSIGSVLVFSGVVAAKSMEACGGQGLIVSLLGLAVAVASGLCWGLVNGALVAKWRVPPLIVTLGTLGMALGGAQILTNGVDIRSAPDILVDYIGYGRLFGQIPILVAIATLVAAIGAFYLHGLRFGRYTYAVGSSAEACRRAGINVDRHLIKVYAISGGLAGLAGLLNLAFFQTTTISGHAGDALVVIAGVVIGGTSLFGGAGLIAGTIIGLFIPAVLQSGFIIVGIQPFWQEIVVGAVLIIAVYVDQINRARSRGGIRS